MRQEMIEGLDYSFIPRNKVEDCKRVIKGCEDFENSGIFIPYLVETPNPYVINLSFYKTVKVRESIISGIKKRVELLRCVLDELGIGVEEARKCNYTLNSSTQIQLMFKAWDSGNDKLKRNIENISFV